jgi:hypothetical protein
MKAMGQKNHFQRKRIMWPGILTKTNILPAGVLQPQSLLPSWLQPQSPLIMCMPSQERERDAPTAPTVILKKQRKKTASSAEAAAKPTGRASAKPTTKPTTKPNKTATTTKSKETHKRVTVETKKTKKVFATNKPKIVNITEMRNRRSQRLTGRKVAEAVEPDSLDMTWLRRRGWNAWLGCRQSTARGITSTHMSKHVSIT